MISTILRIGWLNLRRDRVALLMTFALPVMFYSVFAIIFSNTGGDRTDAVRIAVVDEDNSEASRRLIESLDADDGLSVESTQLVGGAEVPFDRDSARERVRAGGVPVAVILPRGFGESFGDFSGQGVKAILLRDGADPVAPQIVTGLLQKAGMTAAPDLMIRQGLRQFEKYAGELTPTQRIAMDTFLPQLRDLARDGADAANKSASSAPAAKNTGSHAAAAAKPEKSDKKETEKKDAAPGFAGPVSVQVEDVIRGPRKNPAIAFYAAGTAVMFLLFSANASAGSLLEEAERGVLDRLLTSRLSMSLLLLGKWLFTALMGFAQITVMFLWGALVFGVELFTPGHLTGFVAMTAATAAAAAALGLVFATACRTRAQQHGIATIVILVMSAIGGSMFPRFLMPEAMQKVGLLTFNGWALDGYRNVFWRDMSVMELWPQLLVLTGATIVMLFISRQFARRWEAA